MLIWSQNKSADHPKIEYFWNFTHPEAIQDVNEIWRNLALNRLLTNGFSAVNGCHQNESPNSW